MTGAIHPRRLVGQLMVAAVLLQGVLGLVPHTHHDDVADRTAADGAPGGSFMQPELVAVSDHPGPRSCLACVVTTVAFARADHAVPVGCPAASPATDVQPSRTISPPRPWRQPLRGPPLDL